jgi:hypothetical protein
MADIAALWKTVTDGISQHVVQSKRQLPSTVRIPDDHVEQKDQLGQPFERDQHYFNVVINEMFLADARKWFTLIDPLVFVVSEFTYNKKNLEVPFTVGPALLNPVGGEKVPPGMIFKDTPVSGTFPYRGGGLTLSVVLCQLSVGNYASELLQVIESAAKVLDFSPMLSPYTKVAGIVLKGFNTLLGLNGTTPLIALRHTFNPNAGIPFMPSFFALIDEPDVDPQMLWVIGNRLMLGKSKAEATPYRKSDFVLYSVVKPIGNLRDDLDTLPFAPQWDQVVSEAGQGKNKAYQSAKGNMLSLSQTITLSPDLTAPQRTMLKTSYADQMVLEYKRAVELTLRRGLAKPDEFAEARDESLAILDL